MEARPLLRSATSCINVSTRKVSAVSHSSVSITRRHQSSSRRTKKALNIAPHSSFLNVDSAEDHIIFNPPSSAPSVYHTPFKFLPPSDPRRQANITQLFRSSANLTTSNSGILPPVVNTLSETQGTPRHHVTAEQVEEMRKLREQDSNQWSVLKLAQKYDCSPYFVMMCCKASPEKKQKEQQKLEAIKGRWGPIRTQAREDRRKRRDLLHRGEL